MANNGYGQFTDWLIGEPRGRYCMPLRYNKDKREKPVFSRGLSVCRSHVNSFSKVDTDAKIRK